jgi:hypothetical protein
VLGERRETDHIQHQFRRAAAPLRLTHCCCCVWPPAAPRPLTARPAPTNNTGLKVNPDRPHAKLPYRGAWLRAGPGIIHLMELPNKPSDPSDAASRPASKVKPDRHFCIGVGALDALVSRLEGAGVPFTRSDARSASGRPAVCFRDPDAIVIECVETAGRPSAR